MAGLSISALAREAQVSHQGVSAAVRRGVLRRGADGLLDLTIEPNRSWLRLHHKGLDNRGRDMRTYGRRPGTKVAEKVPTKVGNTAELDSPDDAVVGTFTDAELDAILAENAQDLLTLIQEEQRNWCCAKPGGPRVGRGRRR